MHKKAHWLPTVFLLLYHRTKQKICGNCLILFFCRRSLDDSLTSQLVNQASQMKMCVLKCKNNGRKRKLKSRLSRERDGERRLDEYSFGETVNISGRQSSPRHAGTVADLKIVQSRSFVMSLAEHRLYDPSSKHFACACNS
jgi:hypothetical protein